MLVGWLTFYLHFQAMGIFQYKNTTKQLTFDAIRRAQEDSNLSALVVCVIGHGGQGAVEATDGSVRIQDILETMCSPILDGKPKVLHRLTTSC